MTSTAPAGVVPLNRPLYGASIGQALSRFFKKYATFTGRASRSEYWWVALASVIISVVASAVGIAAAGGDVNAANTNPTDPGDIINIIWGLGTLIPSLAVAVRRLHDINKAGWWILIGLIPLVGWIILIVWNASAPRPEGARFDTP